MAATRTTTATTAHLWARNLFLAACRVQKPPSRQLCQLSEEGSLCRNEHMPRATPRRKAKTAGARTVSIMHGVSLP